MADPSPYLHVLLHLAKKNLDEIIITRAGAPDLKGKLNGVEHGGCWLDNNGDDDKLIKTFVAYDDMRGISYVDWDLGSVG